MTQDLNNKKEEYESSVAKRIVNSYQLSAIIESSRDAMIGKTLDGIITSWNKGAEETYGYTSAEMIGKPIKMLVPPDYPDEIPEILEKIKDDKPVDTFETVRMTKSGKKINVLISISPIKNRGGKIIGAATVAHDISKLKKSYDENTRLAAIVQSSEDAILGMTLKGIITSWNKGAEKMFDYKPSEIIGNSIHLIYPSNRADELPVIINKVTKGEKIEHFETQRRKKNGDLIYVSLSISPIKNEVNEIIGISKIIRDITGQKRVAEYTRSLIEASLDPLVTISPDGKITDVNEATVKVTGVSRENLIGTDFSNYFTEPEEARQGYQQVFSKAKVTDYPLTIHHTSGATIDVLYNAAVYKDEKGNVLGVFAAARDVTERKKAEAQLQATSAYARSLIEASLDPLVTISPDGKITDVNEATVKVTGVSRENLIGSDFSNYFTEPEEARQGYQQVFKEGYVIDFPLAIRHVSGQITDVLYNASVYKDKKGNVLGVFAAARDVTERKKAEDQVHATSAYARSLIEASLDPLVTISPDGKITDVNHSTELITGVSREWLTGTDFSNYFTESRKAREGYRLAFKEGVVRDYPLAIRHASGKITDVLYNASVYKDAQGKVRGVFAAARDVTETKKVTQYTRSLIEASLDPLVTISPDGKITDVNHATELITGVSRENLIGTDFSNYFTEPEEARKGYQQVFKESFVTDYPLTIRSTTGKMTDVLYNASVYKDEKGNVLGVFAAARDYTRSKQITQKLEESNKELETFSYTISHDLRAPLRAIDGFSQILSDEYAKQLDNEGQRIIQTVRTSAQHMGKLIDDLLSFSRLGRQAMNINTVDMISLVESIQEELRTTMQERTIEWQVQRLPSSYADGPLIRQVWMNLLSNAVKFTKQRKVATIEVGSNTSERENTYYVKDNGIGFDNSHRDRLFGVFQRLHDSKEYEGTGVGLAIVQHIVKRHGGRVWAEGIANEGATFYFSLPNSKELHRETGYGP